MLLLRAHLVTFYSRINVLDKDQAKLKASTSKHQKEGEWNNCHVPEVKGRLQNTTHATAVEIVVERVHVDEETRHTTIDVGCPPPTVIFSRQLKIKQRNSNEGGHNDKENEGKK